MDIRRGLTAVLMGVLALGAAPAVATASPVHDTTPVHVMAGWRGPYNTMFACTNEAKKYVVISPCTRYDDSKFWFYA